MADSPMTDVVMLEDLIERRKDAAGIIEARKTLGSMGPLVDRLGTKNARAAHATLTGWVGELDPAKDLLDAGRLVARLGHAVGAPAYFNLTEADVARIQSAVKAWMRLAGTKTPKPQKDDLAPRRASRNTEAARIREWGLANGYDLPGRGRLPDSLQAAYRAANG